MPLKDWFSHYAVAMHCTLLTVRSISDTDVFSGTGLLKSSDGWNCSNKIELRFYNDSDCWDRTQGLFYNRAARLTSTQRTHAFLKIMQFTSGILPGSGIISVIIPTLPTILTCCTSAFPGEYFQIGRSLFLSPLVLKDQHNSFDALTSADDVT